MGSPIYSVLSLSSPPLLAELDWWDLRIYALNDVGKKHGILLGTSGWKP
jgi:hypothetical protein